MVTFGSYLEGDHRECQETLEIRDHLESKTRSPVYITSSKEPSLIKLDHTYQHIS